MPHRHSAEASDRRRTRARELGLLQPRTAGHSHLLVREDLKPRVQAMVHSLALHEAHACGAGRPYHYARQASLAASLSPEALQHALEVHRLANRAKHAWNSPRPGTAAAAAAAAHPGSSSTKEDADPVWENDPWAAATSLSSSGCTSPPAKDDCGRTANVASPSCSPIGWIVLAPVYADAEIQKVVGQASLQILRQLQGSEASATAECGTSEGSFVDALDERSQVRQGSMPFASSEVRLRSEVGTPIIKNLPDEVKPLRLLFCDSDDDFKAERPIDNEMFAVDSKQLKKHNQKDNLHSDDGKIFGSLSGHAFVTDGEPSHELHKHDDMQDDIEAIRLIEKEILAADLKKPTKSMPKVSNRKDNVHTDFGKISGSPVGNCFDTEVEPSHEFHKHEDMQDDIEAKTLIDKESTSVFENEGEDEVKLRGMRLDSTCSEPDLRYEYDDSGDDLPDIAAMRLYAKDRFNVDVLKLNNAWPHRRVWLRR